MEGDELLTVAGGSWGRMGALQQYQQPQAEQPSLHNTDLNILGFLLDIRLNDTKKLWVHQTW